MVIYVLVLFLVARHFQPGDGSYFRLSAPPDFDSDPKIYISKVVAAPGLDEVYIYSSPGFRFFFEYFYTEIKDWQQTYLYVNII